MYETNATCFFEAAHRIQGHPKCGRLHGHSWKAELTLAGNTLNAMGFVRDFSEIKKEFDKLDLDHHFLVGTKDVNYRLGDDHIVLLDPIHTTGPTLLVPLGECVLIPIPAATCEYLAEWIYRTLKKTIPQLVRISLWEGAHNFVTYISSDPADVLGLTPEEFALFSKVKVQPNVT